MDTWTWLFVATVFFVIWAGVRGLTRAFTREDGGPPSIRLWSLAVAWLVISALPTATGLVAPGGPVPVQAIMVGVLALAVAVAGSRVGAGLAAAVPLYLLVGFQGFRLPLELVLHEWVSTGLVPPQMTWTGQNVDVVAGALALASMPVVRRWPRFAWVPTVVGSVLLLNVLRVVALSLPGPLQRFPDPITLAYRVPHVWIATVCVAGAVLGHLVAFRSLVRLERVSRERAGAAASAA